MSDRKNLKISETMYEDLKCNKPDHVTWGNYLGHLDEAYWDPRPRIPRLKRESDRTSADVDGFIHPDDTKRIHHDSPERHDLAPKAEELLDEINFRKIFRETDDVTEAKEQLLRDLLTDPDLSGVNSEAPGGERTDLELSTPGDAIAEKVADQVVARLEEESDA